MSLPKLTSSPAFHSLAGAHSLFLRRAARPYRPSLFRSQAYARAFTNTSSCYEQQAQQKTALNKPSSPSSKAQSSSEDSSKRTLQASADDSPSAQAKEQEHSADKTPPSPSPERTAKDTANGSLPAGWEDDSSLDITNFSELPHRFFGYNQHIQINEDFKESLRQILWQFKAPVRYAFAYGSGVFGQKSVSESGSTGSESLSPHPNPPEAVVKWQKGGAKVIDFIFGVSHTQHWHSLNLTQHPNHYSGLKWIPNSSAVVSHMQDDWGAGMYYNPYITVNGVMIKYGVVNLDTLARDLSEWDTLYLAGRLQKPVKILRDDPRIRLANQVNLISALRTALLMLPEKFNERQLYERIAGLSYMGDPRMNSMIASESPTKVSNIVGAQLPGFRQLYVPLIDNLPNVSFTDSRTPHKYAWEKEDAIRHTGTINKLDNVLGGADGLAMAQDLDPVKRGNMVRRLPRAFRRKVYYQYKAKFGIPGSAFDDILEESADDDAATGSFRRREGGDFERRIAVQDDLPEVLARCVRDTVAWPATMQTIKGVFTSGIGRSWKYLAEKRAKGRQKAAAQPKEDGGKE